MEPIHAVYIKEESMLVDTEQDASISMAVPNRSEVEQQKRKLVLFCEQSDFSVMGKIRIASSLSVEPHVSSTSVSSDTRGSCIPIVSQSQYTCAVCLQYFSTRASLINHVFSHDLHVNSPLFICQYCGLVFFNLSKLFAHSFQENKKVMVKEPSLIELACVLCAETFLSLFSLTTHVFTHMPSVSAPLYVCTYCSKVFKDISKLQFHEYISRTSKRRGYCDCKKGNYAYRQQLPIAGLKSNRIEEELVTFCNHSNSFNNENRYKRCKSDELSTMCELHEKSCISRCSLKTNEKDYATFFNEMSKTSFKIFEDPKRHHRRHLAQYPCSSNVCAISFTNDSTLEYHKGIQIRKRQFSCDICRKSFTQSRSLKYHQRIHSGERPFPCDICSKAFTHSKALKKHKRIHSDERPFSCDSCGKTFKQSGHRNIHYRIHLGLRPFFCDICGKSFPISSSLKSHQRIHSGERRFSCDVCGKSLTMSGNLKTHQRIHFAERPFACDACGQLFTSSMLLKHHQRIHLGERPFSCDVCGKSFTQSGHLKSHQLIHLGIRQFSCEVCGKSFTLNGNLKKHKRIHLGKR